MKKTKKLLSLVLAMTLLISTISTTFVFTASAITEVDHTNYAYTVVPDKNDPNFTSEVTSAPEPAEGNAKVTDWRYVVDSTDFKGTEVESYNFTPEGHYYNNTTYFADGDKSGFANIAGYFQFKSADGNPIIDISVDAYNDYWDAVDNYYVASSNDIVISVSSNGKDFTEVHCETALSEAGRDNLKHQVYTKSFTKSDDVKYVRITIKHASAYGVASPGLKALSYNTAKRVGTWDYTVYPDKEDSNFTSEATNAPDPAEGNEKVTDWRYVVDSTDFNGKKVESYNFTPKGHYFNNTTYFANGDKSGFANISGYFQFKSADGSPITDISVDAYNDYWETVDNYYQAGNNDIEISVSSNGKDFTVVNCDTVLTEAGRDNLKHQVYTKTFTTLEQIKYVRITIKHASAYGVATAGLKSLSYNTAEQYSGWDYTVVPNKEDSNFTSEVTNTPEPAEGFEKVSDWRYVVDSTDFKGTEVESYNFTPEGHYYNNTTYFGTDGKANFEQISGYFQFKSADGNPITSISVDAFNNYWETVDNYYQAGNNDIEISVSSDGEKFDIVYCDTALSEAGRDSLKHQIYTKTFSESDLVKYVRITIKHATAYGVATAGLSSLSYNTEKPKASDWDYTVVPNKEDPNFISEVTNAPDPAEGNEKVTDWRYVVDSTDFGKKVESYNFTPKGHYFNNTTYFANGDKSGFANISGYFQFKSADGNPITAISVDAYNDYWEAVDNYYQAGNNDIEISVSSDGEKFVIVNCDTALTETGRDNLKHQIYTKTFTENDLVKYVRITIKHATAYGVATAGLRSLSYNTAKPKASDWDYTVVPNKEDPNFTSEVTNAPDPADGNEKVTDWRYVVDSTDFNGKKVESYNFTPKGHYFNNTTYFEGGEAGRALFEQISGYFQFKSEDGSPITSISVDAYDNYYDDNSRDIEILTSKDGKTFTAVKCDIEFSESGRDNLKHEVYTKTFAENELVMYVRITIKHAAAYGVATAGLKSLSYNTVDSTKAHYQTTVVPDKADPNFSYESDFEFRHITGNALDKFPSNDVSSYNFTPEGFCETDYAPVDTNYAQGTPEYSRSNYTGYFQFKSENGRPITDILVDVYDDYWDLNSRDIVIQYSSNGVTFKNVDFGFKTVDDICAFDDGNFNIWRNLLKYTFEATENVQYIRCVIKSSTRYSAAAAGLRSLSYNTADSLPVADEDINDDGYIDIRDLVALKKVAAGNNSENYLGDINDDGLIGALDLSVIIKYLLTTNTSIIEVDKQTGIKYLDDEFDNWDKIYQRGEDLALESYAPAMFLGDDTRVKRWNDAKDCWMTWKFDVGIEEAAVVIFGHKQYEELEVSVSKDGNEWTALSLPTPEKVSVSDEWEKRTYKFTDIDEANKYLKVDILAYEIRYDENGERLGNSYFPNLARVRINNIANMDIPDYILEDREPTAFYVDSINGFDSNDGTSEDKAFRSLEKISSFDFQPGDKILLKSGQTFYGSLKINGAGTADNGILVSTYGGSEKAKISAKTGNAVSLKAQYITLENLEVTNPNGEKGIYAMPFTTGENKDIVIRNCYIHDIDKKQTNFGQGNYTSAGISIEADGGEPTWFDGVTIENNIIEDVNRVGIIISTNWAYRPGAYGHDGYYNASDDTGRWASKNVIIRGNTVTRAYGDSIMALLCDGAIIEKNTSIEGFYNPKKVAIASAGIWTFGSNDNVIQYNDIGFHNFPEGCSDGEAFDIDKSEKRAIVQYNYSHDNEGGFLLMCNDYGTDGADTVSENAVVRFNLSVNDGKGKKAVWVLDDANKGTKIYNNTTYLGPNVTQPIAHWKAPSEDFTFVNNIFVGRTGRKYDWSTMANIGEDWADAESAWANSIFSNNIMWNVGYDLLEKIDCGMTFSNNISIDPKFVNINLDTTKATRAQAIEAFTPTNLENTAIDVENNGGKDIAGNTFSTIDFYGCVKY